MLVVGIAVVAATVAAGAFGATCQGAVAGVTLAEFSSNVGGCGAGLPIAGLPIAGWVAAVATAVGKCVTEIFSCADSCGGIGSLTLFGREGSVIAKLDSPRTLAAISVSDFDTVVGPMAARSARRVPAVEKSAEIPGVSDRTATARSRSDD